MAPTTKLLAALALLLLIQLPSTAQGSTQTCILRAGEYIMDVTALASTQFPLEYDSPDGHKYRAVLCGATPVLADSCKV